MEINRILEKIFLKKDPIENRKKFAGLSSSRLPPPALGSPVPSSYFTSFIIRLQPPTERKVLS